MMREFLRELGESILAEVIFFILTWKMRLVFSLVILAISVVAVIVIGVLS